jgi:hypothetical protein
LKRHVSCSRKRAKSQLFRSRPPGLSPAGRSGGLQYHTHHQPQHLFIMERSTIIVIILVVLGVGGGSYQLYSKYREKAEKERIAHELAVKAATDKEKKAATDLKRMQEKEQESARKVAELEQQQRDLPAAPTDSAMVVGPLKPGPRGGPNPNAKRAPALIGDPPAPGQPVPPIIPLAEKFISEARLTSTSLDNESMPYAVINRQTYRVGNRIVIAPGHELTVLTIEDGFITFAGGTYKFKMRLTSLNQ